MKHTALLLALLCTGVGLRAQTTPDIESFEFDVETLDGERMTQDDLHDKVVLIDFWGTWCGPCRKAIPHLVKLYEKYKEQGLVVLGLCYERTDTDDEAIEKVEAFAEAKKITYPLALGTEEIRGQIPQFAGYPTMLLFRRGGKLDRMEVGAANATLERIDEWVKDAIKDKVPAKLVKKASDDAALQTTIESVGGREITIGGGKNVLFVLVHPKARPSEDDLAALRARQSKHKDAFDMVLVTREDLDAGPDVLRLKKGDLAKMNLGKAFPAYRLYSKKGKWLFRDAGTGKIVLDAVVGSIDSALQSSDKNTPEEPEKSEKDANEKKSDADKAKAAEKAAQKADKKTDKK